MAALVTYARYARPVRLIYLVLYGKSVEVSPESDGSSLLFLGSVYGVEISSAVVKLEVRMFCQEFHQLPLCPNLLIRKLRMLVKVMSQVFYQRIIFFLHTYFLLAAFLAFLASMSAM